ncbi:3-oxoacyl-ACP synthase [Flavobacteriaceae bacterium F08102]|nr:3-oxoacyl-ACP synthase [Flavobacteriaceae bacterium F08102]
MNTIETKLEAYQFCQSFINKRLLNINQHIGQIQEALRSETKSSAGDKHETGRAHLQLERERLGIQLAEAQKMQSVLSKISLEKTNKKIGIGSFVITNQASYFIAISAGLCKKTPNTIFCISINTPLGKVLAEKKAGDRFLFNNQQIEINQVI